MMYFTIGFMKRSWKSSGVFTPMNAVFSNALRKDFGNQGTKPLMMVLNWRSANSSSKACRISAASYGLISSNSLFSSIVLMLVMFT